MKGQVDKVFFNNIGKFHDGGFKNESHFIRYDMNDLRHANIHNGAGVNPVYKYQGFFDNGVGSMKRGRDSRNEMMDMRLYLSKHKDNSPLIVNNPYQ
tara:strand:- start:246 stop:536 length:291 start_codon:yes stop_codon:yes gene_type:complete